MAVPESDLHYEVYKLVKAAVDKKSQEKEEGEEDDLNAKGGRGDIYDVYMCMDEMEIEEDGQSSNDLVYEELVRQENAAILCYTELSFISYVVVDDE